MCVGGSLCTYDLWGSSNGAGGAPEGSGCDP